ncbi:MAG TPA: hypothetical protein H9709_01305, partial [Candidatus Gemmiger stercoripullorum]|nr:hypothetical protein [Candidatus Gemmiger stercoripullorum]
HKFQVCSIFKVLLGAAPCGTAYLLYLIEHSLSSTFLRFFCPPPPGGAASRDSLISLPPRPAFVNTFLKKV